jgi:hypothetical protein
MFQQISFRDWQVEILILHTLVPRVPKAGKWQSIFSLTNMTLLSTQQIKEL